MSARVWASYGADTARLGAVGMLGAAYFVVIVLLLHVVESEYDPVDYYISDYAVGDVGFLMRTAFLGAGLATLALARGLGISLAPGRRVRPTLILMAVAGVGFLVGGTFNGNVANDAGQIAYTASGVIHTVAGGLVFISLPVVAFLLRGVFARDALWNATARVQLWFAVSLLFAFAWAALTPEGGPVGIPQRVFAAILMAWLLFLGRRLREPASGPSLPGGS